MPKSTAEAIPSPNSKSPLGETPAKLAKRDLVKPTQWCPVCIEAAYLQYTTIIQTVLAVSAVVKIFGKEVFESSLFTEARY